VESGWDPLGAQKTGWKEEKTRNNGDSKFATKFAVYRDDACTEKGEHERGTTRSIPMVCGEVTRRARKRRGTLGRPVFR